MGAGDETWADDSKKAEVLRSDSASIFSPRETDLRAGNDPARTVRMKEALILNKRAGVLSAESWTKLAGGRV